MSDNLWILLAVLFKIISTAAYDLNSPSDVVIIKSHTNVSFINVPTSRKPVTTWINVQKGVFPNISPITDTLTIGQPVSILIYFKDDSNKYDIQVNDCWAYDKETIEGSTYKVKLIDRKSSARLSKFVGEWNKIKMPSPQNITMLCATLMTFKFPDTDKLHLTCNIQLCYRKCNLTTDK